MKIYRFMYKSNVLSVKEFDCVFEDDKYFIPNYYTSFQKRHVSSSEIDKIKYNGGYILWSLTLDSKKYFVDQIINSKEKVMTRLIKSAKNIKKEINSLMEEKN